MPFRLVPPLREVLLRTRFVPCNIRCTGRPRPIPDDGFMRLRGKVFRRDVLWRAWISVQRNRGAPGIDQITLGHVEQYGVTRLLGELAAELGEGRYRPLPTRRVFIPKPGTSEQRPLSIPAVRDRIVQAACKIVLEPIFEADFLPCSFGFRPKRAQHDGLQVLIDEAWPPVGGRDGHRQLLFGDSA